MTKLKPCPFCGGEARLATGVSEKTPTAIVECSICGASAAMYFDTIFDGKNILKAIEAWNRRA